MHILPMWSRVLLTHVNARVEKIQLTVFYRAISVVLLHITRLILQMKNDIARTTDEGKYRTNA